MRIRTRVQPITSNKISRNLAHALLCYYSLEMDRLETRVIKVLGSACDQSMLRCTCFTDIKRAVSRGFCCFWSTLLKSLL